MCNFKILFRVKLLILILFLLQGSFCSPANSKNSGGARAVNTSASFLTNVQGDYRTVFKEGDNYDVRVIIRNRKENQFAFDEYLKDNPIENYAGEPSVLEQLTPDQYSLEVLVQVGQYNNHIVYKEPEDLNSSVVLNYGTIQQKLFSPFIYISGEEFFIGEIHFEKREDGRWILEKIVLWKTGFMIPLFKKKHHIDDFQKVF